MFDFVPEKRFFFPLWSVCPCIVKRLTFCREKVCLYTGKRTYLYTGKQLPLENICIHFNEFAFIVRKVCLFIHLPIAIWIRHWGIVGIITSRVDGPSPRSGSVLQVIRGRLKIQDHMTYNRLHVVFDMTGHWSLIISWMKLGSTLFIHLFIFP